MEGVGVAKAATAKGRLRTHNDHSVVKRVRISATANATLLDRRQGARTQAVVDKDVAVGEAELGLSHGAQALLGS